MLWRCSNHGLTMVNHERYMENQKSIKNFPLFLSTKKKKRKYISLRFPHNSFSHTRQLKLLAQSQKLYHSLQLKQGTPQCQLFTTLLEQWQIQGRVPRDPVPPSLILRPNWDRKGRKQFFLRPPPPPRLLSQGLDDRPPPSPFLKVWICHCGANSVT